MWVSVCVQLVFFMCGSAGIDLAFIENGFIYHTKYDTADRIHTDSIQRAGETSDVMWLDYKIRRMIIIGCKILMYSPINFYRLESYLYVWWWTSQMFNNDVLNMFHLFVDDCVDEQVTTSWRFSNIWWCQKNWATLLNIFMETWFSLICWVCWWWHIPLESEPS